MGRLIIAAFIYVAMFGSSTAYTCTQKVKLHLDPAHTHPRTVETVAHWFEHGVNFTKDYKKWEESQVRDTDAGEVDDSVLPHVKVGPYKPESFQFDPNGALGARETEILRGLFSFSDDPKAIVGHLGTLRELLDARVSEFDGNRSKALEEIRRTYEVKHGFAKPVAINQLISTEGFHEVLARKEPIYDLGNTHVRAGGGPFAGAQLHRDQWVLFMMEYEQNPGRFGGNEIPLSDIYALLGDEKVLDQIDFPEEEYGDRRGISSQNLWFYLADQSGDNTLHMSHTDYFIEIWGTALDIKD